jgi:DNA-directed RNA polymerase omega subunit
MFKLPENLDSKYAFVTLAAARAEQLQMGARPRVRAAEDRKPTVVAQEEVAAGLVTPVDPDAPIEEPAAVDEE